MKASSAPCAIPTIGETSAVGPEGRKAEASLMIPRHLEPRHLAGKDCADWQHRCFGTKTGSEIATVFDPVPSSPLTFQLSWSTTTSLTGTRHQASVGGPPLPGISAARISQAALSTPLA